MTGSDLMSKACEPNGTGTSPLPNGQIEKYLNLLTCRWEAVDGIKIRHEFRFSDFNNSMKFVKKVAKVADKEGHHPNIHIYYNRVIIDLTTHKLHGLTKNDFIMAAKIEKL